MSLAVMSKTRINKNENWEKALVKINEIVGFDQASGTRCWGRLMIHSLVTRHGHGFESNFRSPGPEVLIVTSQSREIPWQCALFCVCIVRYFAPPSEPLSPAVGPQPIVEIVPPSWTS